MPLNYRQTLIIIKHSNLINKVFLDSTKNLRSNLVYIIRLVVHLRTTNKKNKKNCGFPTLKNIEKETRRERSTRKERKRRVRGVERGQPAIY